VRHRRLMVHPLRFAQVAGELAEDCEQGQRVLTARGNETMVQQTRIAKIFEGVCGEFQFMRQLGSEIRRCSVAASDMTEGLRLEEELRRCVEQA